MSLHARGTRGVPGGGEHENLREGYTRGPGGWGTRKFIASIPRMARVLGAPRGSRVENPVNSRATTTDMLRLY